MHYISLSPESPNTPSYLYIYVFYSEVLFLSKVYNTKIAHANMAH